MGYDQHLSAILLDYRQNDFQQTLNDLKQFIQS